MIGLIRSSDARPVAVPDRVRQTVALLARRGYALSAERLAEVCIGGAISPQDVRWAVAAGRDLVMADELVVDRAELARVDQIRSRAIGHQAGAGAYLEMTARFVRALVAFAPFIFLRLMSNTVFFDVRDVNGIRVRKQCQAAVCRQAFE